VTYESCEAENGSAHLFEDGNRIFQLLGQFLEASWATLDFTGKSMHCKDGSRHKGIARVLPGEFVLYAESNDHLHEIVMSAVLIP